MLFRSANFYIERNEKLIILHFIYICLVAKNSYVLKMLVGFKLVHECCRYKLGQRYCKSQQYDDEIAEKKNGT